MKLYSAGNSDHFRLCRDGSEQVSEISDRPADIVCFCCGTNHNIFYCQDGHFYGCGNNECCQLCSNGEEEYQKISALPSFDSLKPTCLICGNNFTAIVNDDGSLYKIGESYSDTLTKLNLDQKVKFASGGWSSLIIIPDGKGIYCCVDGDEYPRYYCDDIQFADCAAGMSQFVALTVDGKVYTWGEGCSCGQGDDFYSQAPKLVDIPEVIVKVFASNYATFLVDEKGGIWVTGYNDYGMIGLKEEIESQSTFIKLPSFTDNKIKCITGGREMNYILTENGEVFASGSGEDYKLMMEDDMDVYGFTRCTAISDKKVDFISAGVEHVIFATDMKNEMKQPAIPLKVTKEDEEPPSSIEAGAQGSKCCLLI